MTSQWKSQKPLLESRPSSLTLPVILLLPYCHSQSITRYYWSYFLIVFLFVCFQHSILSTIPTLVSITDNFIIKRVLSGPCIWSCISKGQTLSHPKMPLCCLSIATRLHFKPSHLAPITSPSSVLSFLIVYNLCSNHTDFTCFFSLKFDLCGCDNTININPFSVHSWYLKLHIASSKLFLIISLI